MFLNDNAIGNLREAVELYLENAIELGMIGDLEESLTAGNSSGFSGTGGFIQSRIFRVFGRVMDSFFANPLPKLS